MGRLDLVSLDDVTVKRGLWFAIKWSTLTAVAESDSAGVSLSSARSSAGNAQAFVEVFMLYNQLRERQKFRSIMKKICLSDYCLN